MKRIILTFILALVALVGMGQTATTKNIDTSIMGTSAPRVKTFTGYQNWYCRSDGKLLYLNLKRLVKINDSTYKLIPDTIKRSPSIGWQ